MTTRHSISCLACALLAALTLPVPGKDVLLHTGPVVPVEIDSLASPDKAADGLTFVKQFFVDSDRLIRLPLVHPPSSPPAISPERAAELAKTSAYSDGEPRSFKIVSNQLLTSSPTGSTKVEYYLVEMLVNGSTEHRAVLMDGSVVKSRLKKIEPDPSVRK